MKKISFLLILLVSLFASCKMDVFLPNPSMPTHKDESIPTDGTWHAPEKLKATQGRKRYIHLTWKPVSDAVRYNIYRATSEFSDFIQVGETRGREAEFIIKAKPGYDVYYRITAVDNLGNESERSEIVHATTLAQPFINDIHGSDDFGDSEIFVSWFMNNVEEYSDSVHYNVICFDDKNKEVQREVCKGTETTVHFKGLNPNTNYTFKVEAYNKENESEESDIVDAATARRLRPNTVTDIKVEKGTSKDKLVVTFKLPDPVDVAVEKNVYNPTPLYFKIYRAEVQENGTAEEFIPVDESFGVYRPEEPAGAIDYTKLKFGDAEPKSYVAGETVTFVDNKNLKRGVKYKYKIQSYAYTERVITSDLSAVVSSDIGWLLPDFTFETEPIKYNFKEVEKNPGEQEQGSSPEVTAETGGGTTLNGEPGTDGTKPTEPVKTKEKTNAELKFNFVMDTLGIEYKFKITETKSDLQQLPVDGVKTYEFDSVGAVKKHVRIFKNLSDHEENINGETLPGEAGYYKYRIDILPKSGGDSIDFYEANGLTLVTDSMDLPKIGDVELAFGYSDKITVKFDWNPAYKYTLKYWDETTSGETTSGEINNDDLLKSKNISSRISTQPSPEINEIVYEDKTAIPGVSRNYQLIIDSQGFNIPGPVMNGIRPKLPELSCEYFYDKLSVTVNNFDSTDTYSLTPKFVNAAENTKLNEYEIQAIESNVSSVAEGDTSQNQPESSLNSKKTYEFKIAKKDNSITEEKIMDSLVAGELVEITVTETKPLVIRTYKDENQLGEESGNVEGVAETGTGTGTEEKNNYTEREGDEQSLENSITTATIGPALLNQKASEGDYLDYITVSWKKVIGANNYIIFRDRYSIDNEGNKSEDPINALSEKYTVKVDGDKITVQSIDETDLQDINNYINVSYDKETETYTLVDKYRPFTEADKESSWRKGQSEITWGAPYKYTVIPVKDENDFYSCYKETKNKNDDVSIGGIKIINTTNVLGGTKGYGWNVTATKGTYSGVGATDLSGNHTNNAIKITWNKPYFDKADGYVVFRKEHNAENWERLQSVDLVEYVDEKSIEQGILYDYSVVNKEYKEVLPDLEFIDYQNRNLKDSNNENQSMGFILPKATINEVSRGGLAVGLEKVSFNAAKINNIYNYMFDGYVVQVRNNNIDDKWHDVFTLSLNDENKNETEYKVEIDNEKTKAINPQGLLKVLRDYKHYYRIRLYRNSNINGETVKIYNKIDDNEFKKDIDTQFITWGCREITIEEFTRAVNLMISQGVYNVWEKGKSDGTISYGDAPWHTPKEGTFKFNSYARESKTKSGLQANFLSITGNLSTEAWGQYYPTKYKSNLIKISPSDSNIKLYTGDIQYFNNGKMTVNYNNQKKTYNYDDQAGKYCPLIMGMGADGFGKNWREYLNDNGEWQ